MTLQRSVRDRVDALLFSELYRGLVTVPEFQRLVDEARVDIIYQSLLQDLQNHTDPLLTGVLIVCQTAGQREQWLVDGHHRYLAYDRLLHSDGYDLRVLCQFIRVADQDEALAVFQRVNNVKPVPEMPCGVSMAGPNRVVKDLRQRYPDIFSASRRCQRPHINEDELIERLGRVFATTAADSAPGVLGRIETLNAQWAARPAQWFIDWLPWDHKSAAAKRSKAAGGAKVSLTELNVWIARIKDKGGFYLGLVKNCGWLEDAFPYVDWHTDQPVSWFVQHPQSSPQQPQQRQEPRPLGSTAAATASTLTARRASPRLRTVIPAWLRNRVWERDRGVCALCSTQIPDKRYFEAAHRISVKNGGETTADNLVVCCGECNKSLGSRNLDDALAAAKVAV